MMHIGAFCCLPQAMFDLNVLYNSTNPTAAMILFIIYEFIVNIMLLVSVCTLQAFGAAQVAQLGAQSRSWW